MNAVTVHTWSAPAHRADLLACPCGQPLEDQARVSCPRCGVTLQHRPAGTDPAGSADPA